jgi:O-antigen/teichoic acid export membrane protein
MVIWWHFKRKYPASQQSGNFGGILKLASPSVLKFSLQIYITTASTAIQLLVARYVSLSSMDAHSAGLLQAVLAIGLSVGAVVGPANILFFAPYINRDLPPSVKMTAANDLIPRLLLLFCLGATPVLLLPELTLRVLYSKDFVGASGILPWFILWQCQFHISSVYQQLLLGLEDTTGYCWITASGNILAAILSVLLVPHFGLSGIGFGFVFSTVYTTVVTLTRLKLRHGIGITPRAISLICISFFGFAAMAVIGGIAPEMPSFGAAVRCTAAIVFLSAIWAGLPSTLKRDLLATLQARIRALARSGSTNPSS